MGGGRGAEKVWTWGGKGMQRIGTFWWQSGLRMFTNKDASHSAERFCWDINPLLLPAGLRYGRVPCGRELGMKRGCWCREEDGVPLGASLEHWEGARWLGEIGCGRSRVHQELGELVKNVQKSRGWHWNLPGDVKWGTETILFKSQRTGRTQSQGRPPLTSESH